MTGSQQASAADQERDAEPAPCGVAFKEWAAVCLALGAGEQILILRKGGLHEGAAGFRVAHRRFWLYPTRFHEDSAHLSPSAAKWLQPAQGMAPPAGQLWLQHLVEVTDVVFLAEWSGLERLADWHGWSAETVRNRFHYREPGLFALVVRVSVRSQPWNLTETTSMAGCRSWVDLPTPLPTTGMHPALPSAEFEIRRLALCAELQRARADGLP
jgi:hypothetical protein